ncbi:hypothetical protein KAR91_36625, partial [Candidatus Pacearchaeota archaeon]|nr:hypothetical protein [Candidatus Pacearchaeota archaeon]
MALNISGYSDPGVLIGEVIVPAGISLATVPDILGIAAIGNRSSRSINEVVTRGQILEEALTFGGTPPHTATLVSRSDRRISNTTVRRTIGVTTITLPDSALSYVSAVLLSTDAGPYDISSPIALGLKMDSGQEITIELVYDAAPAVPVISGSLITVEATFSGTLGDAATRTEVAAAINLGLVAATTLGYGTAYVSAVTDATTGIQFNSQVTGPTSDIRILEPFANDGTIALGFTTPELAETVIELDAAYYDASATYEMDYVAVDSDIDPLTQAATFVHRVGSFAGVTSFIPPTDYILTSGDIDWSPHAAATLTGVLGSGTTPGAFDISTDDMLRLAFDGKAAINIDLNGLASPPPGYVNPADPANATAAEIANNINSVLAVTLNYGPKYLAVAADDSGKVKLTSPVAIGASSLEVAAAASLDASSEVFGLNSTQLPYVVIGTGAQPAVGVIYFATYSYDRLADDYDSPKRFFSEDAMIQDLTPVSAENRLSMLGQIAYDNDAPSIIVSQVNDVSTPGFPTVNEVNAAIDGLEESSLVTDALVDDTRLNVQTHLMAHVENQSSPTEKHYRSGWFGMPTGTEVGDKDTPDSFVYRAAVTLQVAPDSPARGRLFLVSPTEVQRAIINEDGSQTVLTLDSVAVACAVAAKHTSFTSPAISLAGKTIIGFDANTFPTFLKAERAIMASNGVLVVTNIGGRLELLDPVSTEAGGGKLPKFMYRSLAS